MNEFSGRNFAFSRTRFPREGGVRDTALDAVGVGIGAVIVMWVRAFVFGELAGSWSIEGMAAATLMIGFVLETVTSCKKCWKFWTWSGVNVVKSLLNARWTAETSFPAMLGRGILNSCISSSLLYVGVCYVRSVGNRDLRKKIMSVVQAELIEGVSSMKEVRR